MHCPLLLACFATIAVAQPTSAPPTEAQRGPIRVETIARTVEAGPLRIFVARVDLSDPRVELTVTGPMERREGDPDGMEARLFPTDEWAASVGAVLAVNAHFFAKSNGSTSGPWKRDQPVDALGPCISDGREVSPSREDGMPSPTFAFFKDRTARVGMMSAKDLNDADDAVSGICGGKDPSKGMRVEDGRNIAREIDPSEKKRHPRTAAGLSKDCKTLLLVVVDGRQKDWSIGATLAELADIVIELGADDAINLDGGGSSSFFYDPPGPERVTNKPSDGKWRPVATSLGVVLKADAAAQSPASR